MDITPAHQTTTAQPFSTRCEADITPPQSDHDDQFEMLRMSIEDRGITNTSLNDMEKYISTCKDKLAQIQDEIEIAKSDINEQRNTIKSSLTEQDFLIPFQLHRAMGSLNRYSLVYNKVSELKEMLNVFRAKIDEAESCLKFAKELKPS